MASLLLLCVLGANPEANSGPDLQACNPLVGQWRGVGQVRRGSTKGAWQVEGEWKWDFGTEQTGKPRTGKLEYAAKDGKYIRSASLVDGKQGPQLKINDQSFALKIDLQGSPESFDLLSDSLVFEADEALDNGLARVTVRMVARGDRLLMRLETRRPSGRFSLLGEVGFTRVGSKFGQGGSYVECVVTGGLGTIPVKHGGKTYYVCCTGCKEYFESDPEGVLAEYRERKAEEEKEKQEKQAKEG